MIRRPPRSTRTDTLFPYTTLFRSDLYCKAVVETPVNLTPEQRELLDKFEATFVGDGARRHSPKSSTFFDGVKGFWDRSEEHTSELQSLMRISYAVFCLKKKKTKLIMTNRQS